MNNIYPENLNKRLQEKLHSYYILLGEDIVFLKRNQDIIFKFAYQQGFIQKNFINIENNTDWIKIIHFCQKKNLFNHKRILVINYLIKNHSIFLIKNLNKVSLFFYEDILIILKLNQSSSIFLEKKFFNKCIINGVIISCFSPNTNQFINWIKNEIKEKNINIDNHAIFLIYKNYEGNTLFCSKLLEMILLTYPNKHITVEKIKKIINDFRILSPLDWINKILNRNSKDAMSILNRFSKQQYNSLILIRALQRDLLKLIYMKREKKININIFFKKNCIIDMRQKYFIHAYKYIHINQCIQAIKILVQTELKIKKQYNNDIWINLKTLTLILSA
ncbi:DNA polymerase III subunit delta [Buchnera aphidicola]|uniref:DNA polymerase III subunit delta n=1 Tax=Buchnera aphidicola TaxID=9 RepID=UPI003463E013